MINSGRAGATPPRGAISFRVASLSLVTFLASQPYNKKMTYAKHHPAPLPAEIARMKAARAAGVKMKDLVKRFNLSAVTIRKLCANERRNLTMRP